MIVLIALCAALYAAVLIPFKVIVIVPGIFEVRPGAALPVLFSLFFGPAAAWGSAFGNIIGDFFGTIGPGSFFGFLGNFIYGYVPYRVVKAFTNPNESLIKPKGIAVMILAIILASVMCGLIIALGVDYLQIVAFLFLSHLIILNNVIISIILVPILYALLYTRITKLKLAYFQVLSPEEISAPRLKHAGAILLLAIAVVTYLIAGFGVGEQHLSLTMRTFELIMSLLLPLIALILL